MATHAASQHSTPASGAQGTGTRRRPPTLAQCLLCGARAVPPIRSPGVPLSVLEEVNLRLESRVRENRSHGSEGGGAGITGPPYPYNSAGPLALGFGAPRESAP